MWRSSPACGATPSHSTPWPWADQPQTPTFTDQPPGGIARADTSQADEPMASDGARAQPSALSMSVCTALAERLADDPATPPELKRLLAAWTPRESQRVQSLLLDFETEFRGLAERSGPEALERFRDEVLPSLRHAAIVCVAMGLDQMPALRAWLDQGLKAERRVHLLAPLFKVPAQALGWACASAAMAHAPTLWQMRQDALQSGQSRVPWLAGTAMMAAAPLLAWLDSVLDAGWRSLHDRALLRRDARFTNELAAQLHDVPARSEHREAIQQAMIGLALGAALRIGGGTAATAALPDGLRAREFVAMSGVTETVAHSIAPSLWRSQSTRLDGSSPDTHLRALSSTEFIHWAVRSEQTHPSRGRQLKDAFNAMAHSVLKPSTLLRSAVAITPFIAFRGLSMFPMPYPAGFNINHEYDRDPLTRAQGAPIDPLSAALLSSAGTLLAAAAVYTSPLLRSVLEQRLDPLAERLGRQAWQALGRGRQRLASAVGLPRTDRITDEEATLGMAGRATSASARPTAASSTSATGLRALPSSSRPLLDDALRQERDLQESTL